MSIPDSINVTTLIHPATKGAEEAFLGQMVFSPVPEPALLEVLAAVGSQCERLFPDTFQYGQAVRITADNDAAPVEMGVMIVFAPFEDETKARDYMVSASEAMRAEIALAARDDVVPGPDTIQ